MFIYLGVGGCLAHERAARAEECHQALPGFESLEGGQHEEQHEPHLFDHYQFMVKSPRIRL